MRVLRFAVFAIMLCHSATVLAGVVHEYRFEDSPGFLADSVGSADLTASSSAQQVELPTSGRGSTFRYFDFPNGNGAELPQADVLNASTSLTGDFTVELLAHADSLGSAFGDTLAGFGLSQFNTQIGWIFQVRGNFVLITCEGSGYTYTDSGIAAATGKDYYLALAFDLEGGEATFYVQNLTDGDPLQVITKSHSATSYNAISTFSIGASASGTMGFDGLIDEVILSDSVLSQEQLLINHYIPEPASLSLLALGGLGLLRRKRR